MANSNKNVLFDSIFSDIHEVLESLNNEISVLEEIYLTDYNSDKELDYETNELSINETDKTLSASLDMYVYVDNFFTADQAMSQNELNLYLLGIIDASMHATEFKNRIQKKYLTTKYKFEGISICQTPKIHGLTGYISNNAISFTTHSDLCMLCKQRHFGAKYWNTNETFRKLNEWIAHYNWAYLERENYSAKIALNSTNTNFSRSGISNSIDIKNHVSWNFMEN
ncbi:37094_t:CDS:2 [Gigaspora margarita]|uniref:37094_t:CDS:1 n=1 Tax=Gigaspora margarita TaxID=4874 RepID=A0ABN7VM60_GIGMA|nr:37094_t:CDS:2 [Gigaspora margarita]